MSRLKTVQIEGPSGNIAEVNSDNQLHVVMEGKVDSNNSTSIPLGGGAIFTGTSIETLPYAVMVISVYSDVASATDGLSIEQSADGTNWDHCDCYTIPAATGKTFSFQPIARYFRVVYTNGGSAQSEFRLQTTLKKTYVKPSSHRIQDSIIDDDDAELVKAVVTGKNAAGTFVNFQATSVGNFKVSLEELETGVSSNSKSQLNVTPFHADGSEGALISGVNYVSGKSGVDSSTETLQCMTYNHHKIHSGSHYFIADVYDSLALNAVYDIQFTTPNTTTWCHFVFDVYPESETEVYIYEGASITTPGTSITPVNNNRNSGNSSVMTVADIYNTSVANANADTDVSGATLISHAIIGSGGSGGNVSRDREIILKQNTVYCFRALARVAGYLSFSLDWYEHANKN